MSNMSIKLFCRATKLSQISETSVDFKVIMNFTLTNLGLNLTSYNYGKTKNRYNAIFRSNNCMRVLMKVKASYVSVAL